MKIRKLISLLLGAVLCAGSAGCTAQDEDSSADTESLTIKVIDVGKADAIIVTDGSGTMLIDCGNEGDGEKILSDLSDMGITKLDVLQITHFDKDHVGGAAEVMKGIDVASVIYPDYQSSGKAYNSFLKEAESVENVSAISEQTSLSFGKVSFTVYPAPNPELWDSAEDEYDNLMSLVTGFDYDGKRFLFCGDAEKSRIKQMMNQDIDWSCDWMKVPHHGHYGNAVGDFLEAAAPSYAVITDSADDPAEDDTLAVLSDCRSKVFRTSESSVLTTVSGGNISVEYCD